MDEERAQAARQKLVERFGENVRTGGKGSKRQLKKVQHKSGAGDDRKLQTALKKFAPQPFPSIEEVNLFRDDQTVMHFKTPQVQASIKDNLFLVSGPNEIKHIRDLMPGILPQLGPQNMEFLKEFAQQASAQTSVPELIPEENFEDVAETD
mmetsp:Transcript_9656/g.18851  ORF Transcript_9656/g.18851 Transcript_9656/m.18851 type:complete len:151 (-) Transcript_9656:1451-1903(-)